MRTETQEPPSGRSRSRVRLKIAGQIPQSGTIAAISSPRPPNHALHSHRQPRRSAAVRHGSRQTSEEFEESRIELRAPPEEILAVHDALDALAAEDELAAKVVKLRYFVGLTIPEIAEALDISSRSADRNWAFARAWLRTAIEKR